MAKFHNASKHTVDNLRLIAEFISHEFLWSSTPAGDSYWIEVCNRITQLANEARALQLTGIGRRLTTGEVSDLIISSGTVKVAFAKTIHVLDKGRTLCGMTSKPAEWPKDHEWAPMTNIKDINCDACKKAYSGK